MGMIEIGALGDGGLVFDKPRFDLPAAVFTDGYNVEFDVEGVSNMVAPQDVFAEIQGSPLYFEFVQIQKGTRIFVYLTEAAAYASIRGIHFDITRVNGPYNASDDFLWNGGFFHGYLIYNNGRDVPQSYVPYTPETRMKDLVNWPTGLRVRFMIPFGNYLVGLSYSAPNTAAFDEQTVIWSDAAEPGTLPDNWDITDPASRAGVYSLTSTPSRIVGAAILGSELMIYKEDAIWAMRLIGGTYVFQFEERLSNFGLASPRAVVSLGKRHFCVDSSNMYIHNGITAEPVGLDKVRNYFFRNLNQDAKGNIFVIHDEAKYRIWIFFPSGESYHPDKALIWNYRRDTWTLRTVPEALCGAAGFVDTDGAVGDWDSFGDTWDSDAGIWNDDQSAWVSFFTWDSLPLTLHWDDTVLQGVERSVYYVPYIEEASVIYDPVENTSMYNGFVWEGSNPYPPIQFVPQEGDRLEGYVERTNLALVGRDQTGAPTVDRTVYKTLTEFYPEVLFNPLQIRFGTQVVHDGTVDWSDWFDYDPNVDYKLDPFCTEKFLAIAFRSVPGSALKWTVSGYSMNINKGGRY